MGVARRGGILQDFDKERVGYDSTRDRGQRGGPGQQHQLAQDGHRGPMCRRDAGARAQLARVRVSGAQAGANGTPAPGY